MSSRADALQCGHSGGGGDYDCDPLEPSSGDSVQSALERLASATLSSQLTSYETLSNYVIKLLKLFRTDADESVANIRKFCHFTETALNCVQVRLSRKAFEVCVRKLSFWIKTSQSNQSPPTTTTTAVSGGGIDEVANDLDLQNDLLRALGSVLYGAGSMCDSSRNQLLLFPDSLLLSFLDETVSRSADVRRLAFQCLANLAIRLDRGVIHQELQDRIFELLLSALVREKRATDDVVSHLRLVVVCFEGMTSLAQYHKTKFASNLGLIFAAARYYMVLGLPGFYDLPQKQFAPLKNTSIMSNMGSGSGGSSSQQTAFNLALFRAQRTTSQRKGDRRDPVDSSDSEDEDEDGSGPADFSSHFLNHGEGASESKKSPTIDRKEIIGSHDSQFSMICETKERFSAKNRSGSGGAEQEGDSDVCRKMSGVCKKVRFVALRTLHEVLKVAPPKVSFGFWWNFFPDANTSHFVPSHQPFFFLLLKDKNVKSRTEGLNCLAQFLMLARPYILAAADDRHERPMAFTPYSFTLATSIKELNRLLVQITSADYGFVTLPIALKAFSELVLSTPYHKLRFGLLSRIVRHLLNFLNSAHCPTRTEAFKCLTSVVQIEPPLAEVYELFKSPSPPPRAKLMTEEEGENQHAAYHTCPDTPNYRYVRSGAHTPLMSYGLYGASCSWGVSEPHSRNSSSRGSHSSSRMNLSSAPTEQWVGGGGNEDRGGGEMGDPEETTAAVAAAPPKCWSLAVVEDIVFNGHPITKESANPDQDALRVAALNLVAALSGHYLRVLSPSLPSLWHTLSRPLLPLHQLQLPNPPTTTTTASTATAGAVSVEVKLACVRTLAQVARAMCRSMTSTTTTAKEGDTTTATPTTTSTTGHNDPFLLFQRRVLTELLMPLLESCSSKSQLKAATFDCMCALSPEVYQQLTHQPTGSTSTTRGHDLDLNKCVDLVLKYSTADSDPQVCPAALKTLGSYVQSVAPLRADPDFMRQVALTVIALSSSSNRYVRSRSAWVLANLADNFSLSLRFLGGDSSSSSQYSLPCSHYVSPSSCGCPPLGVALFTHCLRAALAQAQDQDRCKYNAVRGICGLLACVKAPLLEEAEVAETIKSCFELIIDSINGPTLSKVQWNTCISAGKIFKNTFLCHSKPFQEYVHQLVLALLQAVEKCPNSRVKINALTSLTEIEGRETFTDKLIVECFLVCLQTFENNENLIDFDHYRHQAEMQHWLCLFMCHLIKLVNQRDFTQVSKMFNQDLSLAVTQSFRNCALRPENEKIFQEVEEKLQELEPKNETLISLISQSRKLSVDSNTFDFASCVAFSTK